MDSAPAEDRSSSSGLCKSLGHGAIAGGTEHLIVNHAAVLEARKHKYSQTHVYMLLHFRFVKAERGDGSEFKVFPAHLSQRRLVANGAMATDKDLNVFWIHVKHLAQERRCSPAAQQAF
ncbi:hypothetical protein JOB18_009586 [Solea senegalensis]|uniref:Uncharacterized protein n=1 Tax=Solea senegalensis TaxID=28829 RepID=A0AAV6SJ37_SOLSE|nr:hypothetical protein JOB18_009586 [Solea senegalensis]